MNYDDAITKSLIEEAISILTLQKVFISTVSAINTVNRMNGKVYQKIKRSHQSLFKQLPNSFPTYNKIAEGVLEYIEEEKRIQEKTKRYLAWYGGNPCSEILLGEPKTSPVGTPADVLEASNRILGISRESMTVTKPVPSCAPMIQDHALGIEPPWHHHPVKEPIKQQLKETIMNATAPLAPTSNNFATRHYIRGADMSLLSNESVFNYIAQFEAEIEKLEAIKAQSTAKTKAIKQLNKDIVKIVKLLDKRKV